MPAQTRISAPGAGGGGGGSGVTSLTGTASQVIVSGSTGAVTLSTPQNIASTSSPTFQRMTLTGPTGSLLTLTPGAAATDYGIATSYTNGGLVNLLHVQSSDAAKGPWRLLVGDTLFSGTQDSVLYLGYNVTNGGGRALTSEPSMRWVIEQDFNTGSQRQVETYWEYWDGTINHRPIFYYRERPGGANAHGLSFKEDVFTFEQFSATGNIIVNFTATGGSQGTYFQEQGDKGLQFWSNGINNGAGITLTSQPFSNSTLAGRVRLLSSPNGSPGANSLANTVGIYTGASSSVRYLARPTGEHGWYQSYTDASNYERLALNMSSGAATFASETAGTGADNLSIAFTPAGTGNVTVNSGLAIKAGASAVNAKAGGALYANTTTTSNSGSGETDLWNQSIAASVLGTNHDTLAFYYAGTIQTSINNKQLRVKFGATTCFDSTAQNPVAATNFVIHGRVIRTGAATQKCSAEMSTTAGNLFTFTGYAAPAETLSGAVTLALTGQGGASTEITFEMGKIWWEAVP